MSDARKTDDMDEHIGYRLRMLRSLRSVTQEELAKCVGISFQQIQKYERGLNRISASRLYEISTIFKVSIRYFYEGYRRNAHLSVCEDIEEDLAQYEYEHENKNEFFKKILRVAARVKEKQQQDYILQLLEDEVDKFILLNQES